MKEKAKSIRLQKRIKAWESRGNTRHDMKCPGSRKK